MTRIPNGTPAPVLGGVDWRKSTYSNSGGTKHCVELAALSVTGQVAVRNSTDPGGPALLLDPAQVAGFIAGIQGGAYDHLLD